MRIKMQDKVKAILLEKAVTRDNDFYLMYSLWQDEFNGFHSRFDRKHAGNVKAKDMLKALAKADYQDLKRYAFLAGLDNKWMKSMRGK